MREASATVVRSTMVGNFRSLRVMNGQRSTAITHFFSFIHANEDGPEARNNHFITMKKALLFLWLSFLSVGTALAVEPTFTPVTKLEAGKTYVFENCRAIDKNSDYRYLCDTSAGNDLEMSKTITTSCYWIVKSDADGALVIMNEQTGGYLFGGKSYEHATSLETAVNTYIFPGTTYPLSIGLSTSNRTNTGTFLNAYNHNQYTCLYTFDGGSEWYAYDFTSSNKGYNDGKFSYQIIGEDAYITGIGSGNFDLNNLTIPDYVTREGINYPVKRILGYAFENLSGFTGILTIGKNVTTIGDSAFKGCTGFTQVVFSNGLTSIGTSAFEGCTGLSGKLDLPKSLTSIGAYAFINCSKLSGDLILPKGLTSIETSTFDGCSSFNGNLILPEGLQYIGGGAFSGCTKFKGNLILPEGLQSIGVSAFYNCSGFTGDLIVPEGLQSISGDAFRNCTGLNGNLILPEGLQSIGSSAFYNCSGFTGNLILPEGLQYIGNNAFCRCTGFNGNLILPEGLQSIGSSAFYNCSGFTENIVLPNSITEIQGNAFYGCNQIKNVVIKAQTPPTCTSDAFPWRSNATLMVPETGIMAYKLQSPWSEFKEVSTIEQLSAIAFAEPTVVCPLKGTVKLKIEKTPMYASGDITYMSSNTAIATVDANGVVTGHSIGSTAIIAMSGTLVASCIVNVESQLPPVISAEALEMEAIVGKVGESIEIHATVIPDDVTDPTVNWSSSNPMVAAVDAEGKVWFNAAGSAIVTAECQGHEFSVPFMVEEVMANSLNVFPVEAIGGVGHQFSLLALHEPENTTDKSVTWESSDPSVASVDSDGHVELTGVGSAQITARSGDHTAISDITVSHDPTVGLTEMASTGVMIDIVSGGITVRNAAQGASIAVYTIDGKVVNGAIVEGEETHLSLSTGIYIVKITPDTVAKVLIK